MDLTRDASYINDRITGFQVGKNVRVKLCDHPNCGGDPKWNAIEVVGPYMVSQITDKNDGISHIVVYAYDPINAPRVTLFSSPNFELGISGTFPVGEYNQQNI